MAQITTKSGFTADIDESKADDIELLDLICDVEDGKIRAYRDICLKLLGKEDMKRLYDHVRTEDGRVPYSAIDREISELFNGFANGKK